MYLRRGMENAGGSYDYSSRLRCAKAAGWGETTARCIDNCGGGEERRRVGCGNRRENLVEIGPVLQYRRSCYKEWKQNAHSHFGSKDF